MNVLHFKRKSVISIKSNILVRKDRKKKPPTSTTTLIILPERELYKRITSTITQIRMSENINPSQDFTIAFPTASLTNHGTTDSVMAHESTSML